MEQISSIVIFDIASTTSAVLFLFSATKVVIIHPTQKGTKPQIWELFEKRGQTPKPSTHCSTMFPSKPSFSSDRNLLECAITLSKQNMQSRDILLHCAKIFSDPLPPSCQRLSLLQTINRLHTIIVPCCY